MQARTCRRLIVAATVAAATMAAPAHAGIWETVDTPTNQTITGIEYRADGALWMTTSSSIFKRANGAWSEFSRPGTNFNAIAFNPAGTVGFAVGDAGVFYRFSGGTWTQQPSLMTRNYPGTYCPSTPQGPYTLTSPIVSDLTNVRWVDNSTVYIFSERYGSLMRSVNGGQTWSEINRQADGTCRLDQRVDDVFVLPSNPNHMLFLGAGYVFLSTNGLTSTAAYRGSGCGNRLSVDPNDPARMYTGGPGCYRFAYSEDGGVNLDAPTVMNGNYGASFAFDAFGSTAIGAGNAGYVFNSIDPDEAYLQPVDGRWATNDWRAADLASTSVGAIGGTNGALIVSDKLNTIPDIVRPTGRITGPANAVAGQTVTFRADVTDERSGIDPNGFTWTKDSTAAGSGQTVAIAFPRSGWYSIRVSYRDLAGNAATASTEIRVSDPPTDTIDPTGTITGPDFAVAGEKATFTANVTDNPGGSGVDSSSFSWSRDFSGAGRGKSVTMTFPAPGTDTVSVSFSDLAGNRNSVSVTVPVAPKPEDRPKPVTVNTPAPVVKKKGGRYVIPIKGGYRLPKNVNAKLGCTGDIVFTMKKAKRLVSARSTKLNTACKYNKSFSVAKSKIGSTKKVGITVRFSGNAWLAPVKKTYQVKVPRG